MSDVIKLTKRVFTVGVVVTTILWSVGASMLVAGVAQAADETCATVKAGDMVKSDIDSAVYTVNTDGEIVYWDEGWQLKTWYAPAGATVGTYKEAGYPTILTLKSDCFKKLTQRTATPLAASLRPGSHPFYRPGTKVLYYVYDNFKVMEISEDAAKAFFGTQTWRTASVKYWPFYTITTGTIATTSLPQQGMLVNDGTKTYTVTDDKGAMTEVTSTGLTANGYNVGYAYKMDTTTTAKMKAGTSTVTAKDTTLTNLTKGAEGTGGTTTTTPVTGDLTVSLGATTPAAATLASGSLYNPLLDVAVTAGSSAVIVTGLTLTRGGLSANTYVSGVSVWDGDKRLGNIMTALTSEGKVSVLFGSDKVTVAANSSKVFKVKINLASTATSGTMYFSVNSKSDVVTEGTITVSGLFPINGNTMSLTNGSTSLGNIRIDDVSVAGLAYSTISGSSVTGNLEVGDQTKEVGKFSFYQANSLEAVQLEKVTFYVEGTIQEATDLKNWKLYSPEGLVLATATVPVNRYVVFTLTTPYKIDKGLTKNFSVKTDVEDGSGRYFRVSIQNDYDVMVKGVTTGSFILPLDGSGTSFDSADTQNANAGFKIKQGDLTVSKSTDSPSTKVAPGGSNVTLAKFDLRSNGEKLEVRQMKIAYQYASGGTALTGTLTVKDATTGETYLSISADSSGLAYTQDPASSTGMTAQNLSTYITVDSGKTKKIEVTGTLSSSAGSSDSYTVHVGAFYAKRISTNDYSTLPNTSSRYSGNAMAVEDVTLTITKDASFGDTYRAPGSTAVKIGQYAFKAPSSDNIKVNSITIGMDHYAKLQNVLLKNESASGTPQLGTTVGSPSAANAVSVDLTVNKDQTVVVSVYADVLSSATGSATTTVDASGISGYGVASSKNLSSTPASDVVGQTITFSAATLTIKADANKPVSQIVLAGSTGIDLNKINLEANRENLTLKKITLDVVPASTTLWTDAQIAANFSKIYLYDGSTPLNTGGASINSSDGLVTISGLNVALTQGTPKVLTVKADMTGSGTLTSKSIASVLVHSSSTDYLEVYSSSGLLSSGVTLTSYAEGNKMLFTDAAPTIAWAGDTGGVRTPDSADVIGKYTITNAGVRPITVSTITIKVTVSGWAVDDTGSVSTFGLYDASDNSLASHTATINTSTVSTTANFASLTEEIAAGGSKTYTLKANTSGIRGGLAASENAYLSTKVEGNKGYNSSEAQAAGAALEEVYWYDGTWIYGYTPTDGSALTNLNASDSGTAYGKTYTY